MNADHSGKTGPGNIGKQPHRPQQEDADPLKEAGEEAPVEYGVESEQAFPRETDYGNQETRYDNKPPGRGHGDGGYGYGGQAGFGPSGGSGVSK